ncbi:MAG: GFA family protein [Janthinobacterium lividum]
MVERVATCRCGQLVAVCTGGPVRVSVCHCLDCQKRSGSAFAAQARFPAECVGMTGDWREWSVVGEGGGGATFRFCPQCGATVAYVSDSMPGLTAVPVGAFADPDFPPPTVSGYEERRHPWVAVLGDTVEHVD